MVSLRVVAPLLVLLAVVPGAVFLVNRADPVVALSTVSVVVLAGSVFYLLSPTEDASPAPHAPPE
jgi:hypothetical protein